MDTHKLNWYVYNRVQQFRQGRRLVDMPILLKTQQLFDKVYFIPRGDDSKHASLNISINPLLLGSTSDSSIPSFNTSSFSTDIPITTSTPKLS